MQQTIYNHLVIACCIIPGKQSADDIYVVERTLGASGLTRESDTRDHQLTPLKCHLDETTVDGKPRAVDISGWRDAYSDFLGVAGLDGKCGGIDAHASSRRNQRNRTKRRVDGFLSKFIRKEIIMG
jgi:hypothetical protein